MVEKSAQPGPWVGRTFSQYEILEKIGEGGMGEVFLANDRTLERPAALKFLRARQNEDEASKRRFVEEAKSAARIDHAYVCKVYETGELDGHAFIAMEYVRGETLSERLAREPVPLGEALRIAVEISEALEAAHRRDVAHRDLKPSNIMLTRDGHVKVMDFGLAKRMPPSESMASENEKETAHRAAGAGVGTTPGTLAYMSPEQLRGQSVDARTDIFSLGVVLYELLSGRHPFLDATPMDTAARILGHEPPLLTQHREEVPELLADIVARMLRKGRGERYASMKEVVAELGRVQARAGSPRSRGGFGLERRSLVMASMAALLLGATAATIGWMVSSSSGDSSTELVSVAVLPLRNISLDPSESDYLADGISQAVTTKLVQVGLRVTPWATAQRYRHALDSPEEIARELNVDAALVGTFQLSGDRIVTTLSLVEAESGLLSWAEEFEEPFEDLFQMQRRIATGAATSLKRELTGEEEELLAVPASRSVDAYDFYLQGAHYMLEGTEEATSVALDYFTRAVEIDDTLAEAHIGIGAVYDARWFFWGHEEANLDLAEASYERALELNPASMRARRGLLMVANYRGVSEACLEQGKLAARDGRPNDTETLMARAQAYLYGGLPDRAVPLYNRVLQIDPPNEAAHWFLTHAYYMTENHAKAIETGLAYDRRFGSDDLIDHWVGVSYLSLGDIEGAGDHYRGTLETSTSFRTLFSAGLFFERTGDRDTAEHAWRRALELLEPGLDVGLETEPNRFFLASLYGLLGERESFLAEKEALGATTAGMWTDSYVLAAVLARLGDGEAASELLLTTVRAGGISPLWKRDFELVAAPMPATEAFREFRKEYDALEARLRQTY